MHRQSFPTGVFFTLLSASGIALIGLFGKLGSHAFSLGPLLFWRYITAAFLLASLFGFFGKLSHIFSITNLKLHCLRAFFVLGAQYSFYYYIDRSTLLNGLVLLSLGPLLIPVIEKVVLGRKLGKSTLVGLIVSFAGVLCILQPDHHIFSLLSLVGVLAGVCQGCSQVVFGITGQKEQPERSVLYMFFFCALFSFFPYLSALIFLEPKQTATLDAVTLILSLGVVSILSQLSRAIAYKHGTPSRLSTFLYFSILLGGFLDWFVFDQTPNGLSIVGACLVVLGGVLKIYLRSIFLKP